MHKNFCYILILTAFLAAIIAPACGFAWNGKYSIIEICNAQGVEQKIVSNDDLPPSDHQKNTQQDCQFCIQKHNFHADIVAYNDVKIRPAPLQKQIIAAQHDIYQSTLSQYYAARAPPLFII